MNSLYWTMPSNQKKVRLLEKSNKYVLGQRISAFFAIAQCSF